MWTRVGVAVMLAVWAGLMTPLNVSSNAIARAFTTDKVAAYFAFAVLVTQLLRYRASALRHAPGLAAIGLLLVSMTWSTYRADDPQSAAFVLSKQVIYIAFCLAWMMVTRTRHANRMLWRWMTNIGVVLAILAIFEPVSLRDVLPTTGTAADIEFEITRSNPFEPGAFSSRESRRSALWFAADNLAYTLMPGILYLIHLLVADRPHRWVVPLRMALLGVLIFVLVGTASRGGTLSTMIGATIIVVLTLWRHPDRVRLGLMVGSLVTVGALAFYSAGTEALTERYLRAMGLFVNIDASASVSGLETGRIETTQLAIDEFVLKPWFGWGGAHAMGYMGNTGNHLGYVDILGQYGIIGFVLNLLLAVIAINRVLAGTRIWKRQGSNEMFMGYFLLGLIAAEMASGVFQTVPIMMLLAWAGAFYLSARLQELGRPGTIAVPRFMPLSSSTPRGIRFTSQV